MAATGGEKHSGEEGRVARAMKPALFIAARGRANAWEPAAVRVPRPAAINHHQQNISPILANRKERLPLNAPGAASSFKLISTRARMEAHSGGGESAQNHEVAKKKKKYRRASARPRRRNLNAVRTATGGKRKSRPVAPRHMAIDEAAQLVGAKSLYRPAWAIDVRRHT